MQSRLGIGIVGAGVISRNHASAYRCLPHLARLVAVADIDEMRATSAKREYGFQEAYTDYRALLSRSDIDVVSICTPPHLHRSIVIDALAAGKHVLCEKPMARTLEEADQMIRAADEHPQSQLSFVYQYRSDPTYSRVQQMIHNNELGRMLVASVRVRARRMPSYYASTPGRGSWAVDGGGVLINQAIHQLDALISFLGNPLEVSGAMHTFLQPTEGEDTLVGWIKFDSGALGSINCTVCAHDDSFAIEIIGENAQAKIWGRPDQRNFTWVLESKSEAVQRALRANGLRDYPDLPTGPRPWTVRGQKLVCKLRSRPWIQPLHWDHTPHVQEFLTALASSRAIAVPPRQARRSLELAVALYEAGITGRTVRFPIDDAHAFYGGITPAAVGRNSKRWATV